MKFVFTVAAFVIIAASLPSCKNCTDCTKYPNATETLCKKDYASEDSYNQRYQTLVGDGYRCD